MLLDAAEGTPSWVIIPFGLGQSLEGCLYRGTVNLAAETERYEAVILGAGVAGLSAARELKGRKICVLEQEKRVGGRTLSEGDDDAWFNLGAQLITSRAMAELSEDLGLDVIPIKAADYGFGVDGRFARGRTPERLLTRMNLSPVEKVDFAITSLRMRRKLHSIAGLDEHDRLAMDRKPLLDVVGRAAPSTLKLYDACAESATGLGLGEVSGLLGLSYALTSYIDPRGKETTAAVRGGTQRVCQAIAASLAGESLRLGCTVTDVRNDPDGVRVSYTDGSGAQTAIKADHCICALPATAVLRVVSEIEPARRRPLQRLTPYSPVITVAWPVADHERGPWDGVFVAPVSGRENFNLIVNYGFLAKQLDPTRGGYLATLGSGTPYSVLDDDELIDDQFSSLCELFPEGGRLIDRSNAVVKRWIGLPAIRPGYYADRNTLRASMGQIHFCGDYTAEPGLPGANGSGRYVGRAVAKALAQAPE